MSEELTTRVNDLITKLNGDEITPSLARRVAEALTELQIKLEYAAEENGQRVAQLRIKDAIIKGLIADRERLGKMVHDFEAAARPRKRVVVKR